MKRIVIVGCGMRCYYTFAKKFKENYQGKVEIVGACDTNIKRCEYFQKTINPEMKIYKAAEFDRMLDDLRPDAVLVTTVDRYHHDYIVRSMKKGYDVYSEKPVTIDEEKCKIIRDAEKETGKKLTITFNCRFMPYFAKLKQIIDSGVIGKPLSITYQYALDRVHGGDYWKRWHRFMGESGGMLLHKSTHHFDIINWILNDEPASVSAQGARLYYGDESKPHGERCHTCQYARTCNSFQDIWTDESLQALWFDAESEDGYQRDHCAFKGDTDIYDTLSVSVAYKKGALLTYSLTFYSTDEGYTLDIVGEKGRIEISNFFKSDGYQLNGAYKMIVHHTDGQVDEIFIPKPTGSHNGGDDLMLDMLFGDQKDDPLGQCADTYDGIKSAMIGIAANQSIKEGRRIDLAPILEKMK